MKVIGSVRTWDHNTERTDRLKIRKQPHVLTALLTCLMNHQEMSPKIMKGRMPRAAPQLAYSYFYTPSVENDREDLPQVLLVIGVGVRRRQIIRFNYAPHVAPNGGNLCDVLLLVCRFFFFFVSSTSCRSLTFLWTAAL